MQIVLSQDLYDMVLKLETAKNSKERYLYLCALEKIFKEYLETVNNFKDMCYNSAMKQIINGK